jgi:hypothetical protein
MVDERPKARRGCLFYGCLTGTILLLIVLAGGLAGFRYFRKMFNDFTDSQPLAMPAVRLTQAEIDKLQQRIDQFRNAVRQGESSGPLALTSDEINALIATDPDLKELKGKLYVTIEAGQLKGRISAPMEQVGLPVFRGRYLNGNGTFSVSLRNGALHVVPVSLSSVKGRPVPEVYMDKIRRQNLAQNMNDDARARAALDKLADIQVKENQLILVPKKSP